MQKIPTIQEVQDIQREHWSTLLNYLMDQVENSEGAERDKHKSTLVDYVYVRCATDVRAFAEIFFPHYCKHPFNRFHFNLFENYKIGKRRTRQVRAAPRGYAKSTMEVLIKPIHDLCYNLEKFIVIISYKEDQSKQKLKDISAELIDNEALQDVYGRFTDRRSLPSTDFIASCDGHKCRFLALGYKTEARGIRFGDARPSKIICDDVEHSTEVESEILRQNQIDWFNDVINKIGDEETSIHFIGTVLHPESLLKYLIKNPRYNANEYKAIISWHTNKEPWDKWKGIICDLDNPKRMEDADKFFEDNRALMLEGTEVLWPEKEPYYDLQKEIIETGIRSFMKEKQNSPLSDEEKVFSEESIWWYRETEQGILIEKTGSLIPWAVLTPIGAIDPSTGQKKVSERKKVDYTCILSGYYDRMGRVFAHFDDTMRRPPSEFTRKIFSNADFHRYEKFAVESNLFRSLLMDIIADERERWIRANRDRERFDMYEVYQTENKEKRIYSIEPHVSHGRILFNKDKISKTFMSQLFDFPKGSHDDCPDTLEMLWSLAHNKYEVKAI